MGISDPATVTSVRYRGNGWPGKAVATARGAEGAEVRREMTYAESWGGILEKHRQWRCYLCVDHSGEFADIAVGDPWYRTIPEGEPGRSLILVRSARGREMMAGALAAGYIVAERADPGIVEASQRGFPAVRGKVWGRLLMCRLLGAAAPRYVNMAMFRFWWGTLTVKQKLQSLYGTGKRIFRKGLRRRAAIDAR
jgi:coenzyme F420 hydrogenase subunit beta